MLLIDKVQIVFFGPNHRWSLEKKGAACDECNARALIGFGDVLADSGTVMDRKFKQSISKQPPR